MFGIAAGLFAGAFFASAGSPVQLGWFSGMGWLSIVASIGAISFGIVQAQTGYTDLSMSFQTGLTPAVIWIIAVGVFSTGTRSTSRPLRKPPTGRTTSTVTIRLANLSGSSG